MAAALECWSGRPSTDEDIAEQVLMSNTYRSHLSPSSSSSSSLSQTPSNPKKWHRLLQTLSSLKPSILDPKPLDKQHHHQWGTLIRNLTGLYPGSQLPDKLISDVRRHFDSLPPAYALAAFDIKDVLLHLRLLHQAAAAAAPDHLAVHVQEQQQDQESDGAGLLLNITFACASSVSAPAASNLVDGSCRRVHVFERKGLTLGVVVVEGGDGVDKEVIRGRVESALRFAIRRPAKKLPFGLCGCQEQEQDGLVRGEQIQLVRVDEWQTVQMGNNNKDEIARWMLDPKEVEFLDQMGANSFKGLCRGRRVWIKKMKGCEGGNAYEVGIRCDLVQLMSCGNGNLLQFVGVCIDERHGLCVVTRMMDGGSVRDLIERRKKLEAKEVMRIGLDVAEGLMFMNGHGVAYRDLNASRILLDKQGNALLGDMGIVASCSNGGEVTEYETEGYRWLAPEIIAGDPESVTETWMSNVYSFGMVIWEMVTGKEAYSSYSPVQAAVEIAACGLRPDIPKDCSQVLRSLMMKCWNKCPSKRPHFSEIISILQKQNNR